MTSAEWNKAFEEGNVCGARHPQFAITCGLRSGPNALADVQPDGSSSAIPSTISDVHDAPPAQREVHVHKGLDLDGHVHRWEDQTAPEGGE